MATNLRYEGSTVQYTNGGSAISSGDVVVINTTTNLCGVALVDIAGGETGTVDTGIPVRVYEVPKTSANTPSLGGYAYYDGSEATTTAGTDPILGLWWSDNTGAVAGNGDTVGLVAVGLRNAANTA